MLRLLRYSLFNTHRPMFNIWGVSIYVGLVDYSYIGNDNDGHFRGIFLFKEGIE